MSKERMLSDHAATAITMGLIIFVAIVILLLIARPSHASCAANTQAFYLLNANGLDNCGSNNLTQSGTVPFNGPGCQAGNTHASGIYSDANYWTAPAGLGTTLNGATWNVFEGYLYLVSKAGGNAAFQTLAYGSSTFITRLNVTNSALRWDDTITSIEGGTVNTGICINFAFVGTATSRKIYFNNTVVASDSNNGIWPNAAPVIGTLHPLAADGYFFNGYFDGLRFSSGSGSPPTNFPTTDGPVSTPTSTMTPTYTVTQTYTYTSTVTPTFTSTVTQTYTRTITQTSSITQTFTVTPTITPTPTITLTYTPDSPYRLVPINQAPNSILNQIQKIFSNQINPVPSSQIGHP